MLDVSSQCLTMVIITGSMMLVMLSIDCWLLKVAPSLEYIGVVVELPLVAKRGPISVCPFYVIMRRNVYATSFVYGTKHLGWVWCSLCYSRIFIYHFSILHTAPHPLTNLEYRSEKKRFEYTLHDYPSLDLFFFWGCVDIFGTLTVNGRVRLFEYCRGSETKSADDYYYRPDRLYPAISRLWRFRRVHLVRRTLLLLLTILNTVLGLLKSVRIG